MARKADEGRVSRNGKPVNIPPYKAPRQKTTKGKVQTRVSTVVIEVLDSEDKGKGVVESDSEEDTVGVGLGQSRYTRDRVARQ